MTFPGHDALSPSYCGGLSVPVQVLMGSTRKAEMGFAANLYPGVTPVLLGGSLSGGLVGVSLVWLTWLTCFVDLGCFGWLGLIDSWLVCWAGWILLEFFPRARAFRAIYPLAMIQLTDVAYTLL